jgi:hypothetical protein
MTYNELLQALFERSNALEALWTIYVTVVGALLGFCATRQRLGLWTMCVVTVAFCLFAAGNLLGMRDVTLQRVALDVTLMNYDPPPEAKLSNNVMELQKLVTPTLHPTPFEGVPGILAYHLTLDSLTIAALWIIAYRPGKGGQTASSGT